MLDPVKLATLRSVVRTGSFSAAAVELDLTQPAVSRQVSLLERAVGAQLVRRTRQGVFATEAGRLLVEHADGILGRIAAAEAQIAELAGLRQGRVRLGSFFSALVYLSAEAGFELAQRHPGLVITDELVDRAAAWKRLRAGELDAAIVFEHAFEPAGAPDDVELVPLFDDPPRALLPAAHPLAGARSVRAADLAGDTWIRAHEGSAARLVDVVLREAGVSPVLRAAGHGDEPVEAQAFIAAGHGVTVAHELNVLVAGDRVAVVPLEGAPVRHVQAAVMRGDRTPAARAMLAALREVGRRRGG